ncbi:MAG: hypothetical protein BWY86_01290 [Candidatus Aminicenantes bacterium ADurb.Bin508]|nr:MAG: hypothetical protein BWY86_01290 [Candidatus Aminicenantes bacterium ADurb.Bin508]
MRWSNSLMRTAEALRAFLPRWGVEAWVALPLSVNLYQSRDFSEIPTLRPSGDPPSATR